MQYWRKRLSELITDKEISKVDLAEMMAEEDNFFSGTNGYMRLLSAVNNRAGLTTTARAVKVLEELFDEESEEKTSPTKTLKRRLNLTQK